MGEALSSMIQERKIKIEEEEEEEEVEEGEEDEGEEEGGRERRKRKAHNLLMSVRRTLKVEVL